MILSNSIKSRNVVRIKLNKDIEIFLKKGGKIEVLPAVEFDYNYKPVRIGGTIHDMQ